MADINLWSLDDGTVWPVNVGEIEHALRYGTPTPRDLRIAASVLGAYQHLTDKTRTVRDAEKSLHRARRAQREAPADRDQAADVGSVTREQP